MTMPSLLHRFTRLVAIVAALFGVAAPAAAQTDIQLSQFYEVPSLYNAAAIGLSDNVRVRLGGRLQWLGIDNAPKAFLGTADMPFKFLGKRFGVGIAVSQESAGLYKSLNIGAQLAFKFKKWGGEWSIGVQPGFYDQAFKGSEVFIPDDDDYHQSSDEGIPTSDIHGSTFDIAAGIHYKHKYFAVGVSATHLTSPSIKLDAAAGSGDTGSTDAASERYYEFKARRTLYFIAEGNIPIKNTLFEIAPALLVKSDFTFTTGEAHLRGRYNKMFSFGIGYRYDDALIFSIAADIKNFHIGYSYDYATSAIHKASSGSHEISLGYCFKLNLGDKNLNRHKSIRIM